VTANEQRKIQQFRNRLEGAIGYSHDMVEKACAASLDAPSYHTGNLAALRLVEQWADELGIGEPVGKGGAE
jgi:hypothetical protein